MSQSLDHARALFEKFEYLEARSEFKALQKSDSNSPEASYYLGRIAAIELDQAEAISQLERAVALEDSNGLYHAALGNAVCVMTFQSNKLKQPFMARRFIKEWKRALALDPNLNETRLSLVRVLAIAPGLVGGSVDEARRQAANLETRSPLLAAVARGTIAEHEKNAAGAYAAYEQGIANGPASIIGYVFLAEAYVRAGEAGKALSTLDGYLKRQSNEPWGLFQFGRVAAGSGEQLERGEESLQRFLSTLPRDAQPRDIAEAHYRLAQIAERRGSKELATEHYRTAEKLNPRVAAVRELRTWACR